MIDLNENTMDIEEDTQKTDILPSQLKMKAMV